ncbi:hypothetical protein LEP1GSC111_2577 [Leptospira interrogans str. UT126]|nr:hypothetical protein LEP1GSC111_2577 [Leptospira interrogans str. UT126]
MEINCAGVTFKITLELLIEPRAADISLDPGVSVFVIPLLPLVFLISAISVLEEFQVT